MRLQKMAHQPHHLMRISMASMEKIMAKRFISLRGRWGQIFFYRIFEFSNSRIFNFAPPRHAHGVLIVQPGPSDHQLVLLIDGRVAVALGLVRLDLAGVLLARLVLDHVLRVKKMAGTWFSKKTVRLARISET